MVFQTDLGPASVCGLAVFGLGLVSLVMVVRPLVCVLPRHPTSGWCRGAELTAQWT